MATLSYVRSLPPPPPIPSPPTRGPKDPPGAKGLQYARIGCFTSVCLPVYPGTPPIYPRIKGIVACSLQTLSAPCRHCLLLVDTSYLL